MVPPKAATLDELVMFKKLYVPSFCWAKLIAVNDKKTNSMYNFFLMILILFGKRNIVLIIIKNPTNLYLF